MKFGLGVAIFVVLGVASCTSSSGQTAVKPTASLPACPTRASVYIDYVTGNEIQSGSAPSPLPVPGVDPLARVTPLGGRDRAIEAAQRIGVKGTVVSATLGRQNVIDHQFGSSPPPDRWVWVVIFAGHYGFMHTQCSG